MKLYNLVEGDHFKFTDAFVTAEYTFTGKTDQQTSLFLCYDKRGDIYHFAGYTPVLLIGGS